MSALEVLNDSDIDQIETIGRCVKIIEHGKQGWHLNEEIHYEFMGVAGVAYVSNLVRSESGTKFTIRKRWWSDYTSKGHRV